MYKIRELIRNIPALFGVTLILVGITIILNISIHYCNYSNDLFVEKTVLNSGFIRNGDVFLYDPLNGSGIIELEVPLKSFGGFWVEFSTESGEDVKDDIVYVDLFNGEENYDEDNQQFSAKIENGYGVIRGVLRTGIAPKMAQLRIVSFAQNSFKISNIHIYEIPYFIMISQLITKILSVISAFFLLYSIHSWVKKNKREKSKRNQTLDIMKGLGVYLVIMGHLQRPEQIGEGIWDTIYAFHMPMFFMISGYLFSSRDRKFGDFLVHKIKSILIPYTLLYGISILFYAFLEKKWENIFRIREIIKGWLLSGPYLIDANTNNFPLWFLPHLFLVTIIFYFLVKLQRKLLLVCVAGLMIITIPYQSLFKEIYFIWEINVLPASLAFMGIGYLFRGYEFKIKRFSFDWAWIILLGGIIAAPNRGASIMDIKNYTYFLAACLFVYGIYRICDSCNNDLLSFVGKNSIITYGLHTLVDSTCYISGVYNYFSRYYSGMALFLWNLAVVYLADMLICVIILDFSFYFSRFRIKDNK